VEQMSTVQIVEGPEYAKETPKSEIDITSIKAHLQLAFLGPGVLTEDIVDLPEFVPDWKSPPDFHIDLVFEDFKNTLDNTWTRVGTEFNKVGLAIDSITYLRMMYKVKPYTGIDTIRVNNPGASPMLVTIWGETDAGAAVGGMLTVICPGYGSVEPNVVRLGKDIKNEAATYMCVAANIYNVLIPYNSIIINAGKTGFYCTNFGVNEAGLPRGPQVWFTTRNIIDEYGILIAAIGGGLTGAGESYLALLRTPAVTKLAGVLGMSFLEVAAIFAWALWNNWRKPSDILDLLVPEMIAGGAPAAAAAMFAWMPERYQSYFNTQLGTVARMGVGAVAGAGGAWLLLNVIDDVELAVLA